MVAEEVGETQIIAHAGEVVGVGDGEGVVEIRGAVPKGHGAGQHCPGGREAPQPHQPDPDRGAALPPPCGQQIAQHYAHQGKEHHAGDQRPGQVEVIAAGGVGGLLQEAEVPGDQGLIPDLDLQPVGNGHAGGDKAHQGCGVKGIAEQKGEGQHQQKDGQIVEHQQVGLEPQHVQKHGLGAHRVHPQHQQRHSAGEHKDE